MTAAEKLNWFLDNMTAAIAADCPPTRYELLRNASSVLTFTDDEPATPAQEPDWRDEVVGWGTGWEKAGLESVERKTPTVAFQVMAAGEVYAGFTPLVGPNHDPRSRCRAIDRFLSELAGEGVK